MLNLFTPAKSRSTHTRSQSTPYLHPTQSTSDAPNTHSSNHGQHILISSLQQLPEPPSLTHPPDSAAQAVHHLPPLVTQDLPPTRPKRSSTRLADWFSGESDPIVFNIIPSPTKEKLDPVDKMDPSTPSSTAETKPAARDTQKPPLISRFSLFGNNNKSSNPKPSLKLTDIDDEWLRLDVKTALSPIDPLSPSALKTLQQTAEGLLTKMHSAYKDRSRALQDVIAEKEAQAEELEGSQTRTRHLKLQLDGMTTKLVEQDRAMMDLVDQLAQEKQARREAGDARKQQCATGVVKGERGTGKAERCDGTEKQWNCRTSTASEMSLESEESCGESLFSRRGATSPTMSMSSVSTMNSPESQLPPSMIISTAHRPQRQPSTAAPQHHQQQRTKPESTVTPLAECNKCHGLKESEAWSLLGILKLENLGLKTRLGQLEDTVDDCLGLVKGMF